VKAVWGYWFCSLTAETIGLKSSGYSKGFPFLLIRWLDLELLLTESITCKEQYICLLHIVFLATTSGSQWKSFINVPENLVTEYHANDVVPAARSRVTSLAPIKPAIVPPHCETGVRIHAPVSRISVHTFYLLSLCVGNIRTLFECYPYPYYSIKQLNRDCQPQWHVRLRTARKLGSLVRWILLKV
jgi:hypothetical protein